MSALVAFEMKGMEERESCEELLKECLGNLREEARLNARVGVPGMNENGGELLVVCRNDDQQLEVLLRKRRYSQVHMDE